MNATAARLIGVVHLKPLPASPRFAGDLSAVEDAARADAETLLAAGFDGYIVENFGDAPFFADRVPPITVAAMTRIVTSLPRPGDALLGINVLRNDADAALAIAAAVDATFVRINVHIGAAVTDQGVVTGRAAHTLRRRAALLADDVRIAADVDVKHAAPLSGARFDLAEAAEETAYRGLADILIASGSGTGKPTSSHDLRVIKAAVPDRPLWVGSGATVESAAELLQVADALIVGTATKAGGVTTAPVDLARAKALVTAIRG